jgi:hypothetical protein
MSQWGLPVRPRSADRKKVRPTGRYGSVSCDSRRLSSRTWIQYLTGHHDHAHANYGWRMAADGRSPMSFCAGTRCLWLDYGSDWVRDTNIPTLSSVLEYYSLSALHSFVIYLPGIYPLFIASFWNSALSGLALANEHLVQGPGGRGLGRITYVSGTVFLFSCRPWNWFILEEKGSPIGHNSKS